LPDALAHHDLLQTAWQDINPAHYWDCHVHLVGDGEPGGDAWINPQAHSLRYPLQYLQRQFYLNAACAANSERRSAAYVDRLLALHRDFPAGARFMLLAFDHHHNERGERVLEMSPIYTSNEYAARVAGAHPRAFEWIASVHPYREDCVAALEWAASHNARAVKWLPNAMGIDPASPLCDRFYQAMARLKLPLLSHAGDEHAVPGGAADGLGNPLRLRRALDHGVRVIVAHCGSLGVGADLDRGPDAPSVPNLELFTRLMDEPRYRGLLFGDISAMTQINYNDTGLIAVLTRADWHARLVNGSDYPLPGVMPLISTRHFVRSGLLDEADASVLSEVRRYNPMLFDFLLKRRLRWNGQRFGPAVFESRRVLGR
jgi:mannonate dehydratase